MEQAAGSGSHPLLTRSDAWLLAALAEGSHDGRPVSLRDFVHDADWLNRLIPTFDEMRFGLPRLVAAGFLIVGYDALEGLVFRATPMATKLRRSVKAKTLGDVLNGVRQSGRGRPVPRARTGGGPFPWSLACPRAGRPRYRRC